LVDIISKAIELALVQISEPLKLEDPVQQWLYNLDELERRSSRTGNLKPIKRDTLCGSLLYSKFPG